MEEQQRIEQERLKKRRAGGDDIEQIDLAAGRLLVNRGLCFYIFSFILCIFFKFLIEKLILYCLGHPATDPDICVAPHLTHILQPHQLGGIRFMLVLRYFSRFSLSFPLKYYILNHFISIIPL